MRGGSRAPMGGRGPRRWSDPDAGGPKELSDALRQMAARQLPPASRVDALHARVRAALAAAPPGGGDPGAGGLGEQAPSASGPAATTGHVASTALAKLGLGALVAAGLTWSVVDMRAPVEVPAPTMPRVPESEAASEPAPAPRELVAPGEQLPAPAPTADELVAPVPVPNAPHLRPPGPAKALPTRRRRDPPGLVGRAVGASETPTEVSLLGAGQRALRVDPAEALRLCRAHRRHHPQGALLQEREVLCIDALVALGRSEDAARRARAFIRRFPRSNHRSRIQALLEQPVRERD